MHGPYASILAGIFVGGGSTRMGGRPKGLLRTSSGETLVERWKNLFDALSIPCVLVGDRAGDAYRGAGLEILADDRADDDLGPLGGLLALLGRARDGAAIAVACDMPFVSPELVRRLISAAPSPVVAARRDGRWEPFFARYEPEIVLPTALVHATAGRRSLQALLDAVTAQELALTSSEHAELRDWDTPEDATEGASGHRGR
jgi:molybdopterin-guanine dinucleotide biosynthesis protein A